MSAVDLGIEGLTDYEKVGAGGFATVYAAQETGTGRKVAVKVLTDVDAGGRRRFDRERQMMGRTTDHASIVTLFRAGYTADDQPYLVMEYLSGGSLQDRIEQRGPLPWAEALEVTVTIARALEFGHRFGILHKDVKPANILVSDVTGDVKLTDFGIAVVKDGTQASQVAYSLHYSPPETFDAAKDPETGDLVDPRDERSDLYSLAATLMALGTGAAPFDSPTQASLMRRILTEAPPQVGISDLDDFFAAALAKLPDDRPTDANAFIAALSAIELRSEAETQIAPTGNSGETVAAPQEASPAATVAAGAGTSEQTDAGARTRPAASPSECEPAPDTDTDYVAAAGAKASSTPPGAGTAVAEAGEGRARPAEATAVGGHGGSAPSGGSTGGRRRSLLVGGLVAGLLLVGVIIVALVAATSGPDGFNGRYSFTTTIGSVEYDVSGRIYGTEGDMTLTRWDPTTGQETFESHDLVLLNQTDFGALYTSEQYDVRFDPGSGWWVPDGFRDGTGILTPNLNDAFGEPVE